MENFYYKKSLKCPICLFEFSSTKIKLKAIKVKSKDEDFCVHYKDYNPMYYEIFICPNCGYGASNNSFNDINDIERELLMKAFAGREIGRDFSGIRTHMDALDSFKIALYTANLKKAKDSVIAGLALKTAWMHRYIKDNSELVFLKMALEYYKEAYNNEDFHNNNIDELVVIYLIGEISRRVGMYEDSITWFNRLINHPSKDKNRRIEKLAREQWRSVRETIKAGI